jgi:predicted SAM-dependent methyltransferase
MVKLHIGCGERNLPGWINIDTDGQADLKIDVRNGLPFPSDSVDFIFHEHFIEHLSRDEGIAFIREVHRVLKPGGVLRTAAPDLEEIVGQYRTGAWRDAEWITRFGYAWIPNGCVMLNVALREWGHKHVYDLEDLTAVLNLGGFRVAHKKTIGVSDYPELSNLEHRQDSLVVEAIKD